MLKRDKIAILLRARELKEGGYKSKEGLCDTLALPNTNQRGILRRFFVKWPEFSGCHIWPIHTNKSLSKCGQYEQAYDKGELYSNKPYGKARKRLLDFIISELEKELQ